MTGPRGGGEAGKAGDLVWFLGQSTGAGTWLEKAAKGASNGVN